MTGLERGRTGPAARGLRAVPAGVWMLGFVSLFMDVSSEMIHALLPLYIVSVLGAGALAVGLIEGLAEATALVARLFSGLLSDWVGRRKPLAVLGYGLAALTKPLFPLAGSVGLVFVARFVDRLGKGIRGAPRDALVADLTPLPLRGAAYGLRQTLDTVGAFAGPLLAVGFMTLTSDNFRLVFWVAVAPAFLAVALLVLGVREPAGSTPDPVRPKIHLSELSRFGATYWSLIAVGAGLALARLGEAFLVLRAYDLHLAAALVPLVIVVMNLAYALSAYPAGRLSDQFGRLGPFGVGIGLLLISDLMLALAPNLPTMAVAVIFWGLHMGFTQGIIAALIADAAPAELRGTGFGVFSLALGLATFGAAALAGWLWDGYGPSVAFTGGTAAAALSLLGTIVLWRRERQARRQRRGNRV